MRGALKTLTIMLAAVAAMIALPGAALAQRAGTLIDAQSAREAPAGMRAWRIRYWTTSDRGRPIQVTGMVIAPRGRPGREPRPVIAWTHGALGVASRCAPSIGELNFTMIPTLSDVLRRGYTVVAPDYPGLGSEGMHPFLVGTSTAHSVLDAVRAAGGIREAAASRRFALWGESQGGHAALWSGQLARSYAPDLDLVGVAAIVPPTDLARNFADGSDQNARAMLTAFTATSWSRHFGAPLTAFGRRSTQNVIIRLADNNCIEVSGRPRLGTIIGIAVARQAIRGVDLARTQPWGALMRENSVSPRAVPSPLMVVQGTADTIVAPAVTLDFVWRACASGKTVRFISVPGGEHATVARTEVRTTLDWIDARFRGERAPNDCRSLS
ncbi:alpha/beta fold hydrolase [Sphingosinicella sp. LHD-64]|uniref:alpha/beta fold hydrolase n=1 Tax=Sphingosinicella sp. LHD-64 TaxID=3072139 RepID=UPI00280FFED1|nr:alpha/beta fold hydrolase [Sphingosinicella sp. LHD-64]MDQ8755421.1 alpha/beta fold hydrolase [Sphingosinicella sp. LHD-64]